MIGPSAGVTANKLQSAAGGADSPAVSWRRDAVRDYISRVMLRKRADWTRLLPQPLQIIDENDKLVLTLKTLGDVRTMLLRLPEAFQSKTTWGHVAAMLDEAARGGDLTDVVVPLRMVLGKEGVACRPK